MAGALQLHDLMTVDEFLRWDSSGSYLWQLVDGVPMAMAPPAPPHGAIQSEVISLIRNHLLERQPERRDLTGRTDRVRKVPVNAVSRTPGFRSHQTW